MPNYIKIPREIIYDKSIGDKRVILYCYLYSRRSLDDTVAFSISELCYWSRLKPNYHDGKINQKYLTVLKQLSELDYFSSFPDFEKLSKGKKNSTDYYNVEINTEKFDVYDNFGIIYFDELKRILDFKEELKEEDIDISRMSSAYILLVLSYLRVNINKSGDAPQCCFRLYKTIAEGIGLSERYISRVVEILDVLNIVKHREGKRFRYQDGDSFGFTGAPKIFADYKRYTKTEDGNFIIDDDYDYKIEIDKQLKLLSMNTS